MKQPIPGLAEHVARAHSKHLADESAQIALTRAVRIAAHDGEHTITTTGKGAKP